MKRRMVFILLMLMGLACNWLIDPGLYPIGERDIIYLSDQGSDDGSGSQGQPVRTLRRAIELSDGKLDICATVGGYPACRADLKTSLYGGYRYDFSGLDSCGKTEIVGTGYWGDSLPVIQVIGASNLVIDRVTIRVGETANFRPCGIYFEDCDSTVVLRNCEIYGQLAGDAKGMAAVYIWEASPKIVNNYIYGGNLGIDFEAVNGIRCAYSQSVIRNNVINAGKNVGCLHGISTRYSKCQIIGNFIYGGESQESCYSCAIRTGDAIESWNDSGSEDLIQDNQLNGGIGFRTYGIICSQASRQIIKGNLIDGGSGEIVSMGVYIKTNDHPEIRGNIFQNCSYGSYEWNFRDYAPGETSNCLCIRDNSFRASVRVLVHWYYELPEDTEHDVTDLVSIVQTEEGRGTLGGWGNKRGN